MNCAEVAERLGAYADGELPKAAREPLEKHVESCAVCSREADRTTRNVAFLKRHLGHLAAGELDAGFLEALRPKTKAEVAAAEREALGVEPSHRVRNLLLAVVGIVVLVGAYLILFGNGDGDGDASSTAPGPAGRSGRSPDTRPVRPPPPGPSRTTPRRPDRDRPVRPVPVPRDRGPKLADLSQEIARARRAPDASEKVPRILQQAAVKVRASGGVEEVRKQVLEGSEPEIVGLLLVILGSAPDASTVRPLLETLLRSRPEPDVRAGAAIGLCRATPWPHRISFLGRFAIPASAPDTATVSTLASAAESEADAGVLRVLADLLAAAARKEEAAGRALFSMLRGATDAALTEAILRGLRGAKGLDASEVESWIASGQAPEGALGHALEMLQSLDRARAASVAANMLATPQSVEVRKILAGALGGGSAEVVAPALARLLREDEDVGVRRRAMETLIGLGRQYAEGPLRDASTSDADADIRRMAGDALRAMEKAAGEGD